MKNLIKVLVLVSLLKSSYSKFECSYSPNCPCQPGPPIKFVCLASKTIEIINKKMIKITCDSNVESIDSNLLPPINIGDVPELIIEKCPFLPEDIKVIAKSIDHELIKRINLKGNNLTVIKSGFFEDFEQLEEIKIILNNLSELDENAFQEVKNLKHLILMSNNVTLKKNFFRNLSSLIYLDLLDTIIEDIPSGVFKNLINLETLYLKFYNLSTLRSSTFSGLEKLKVLDLSHNQIEHLNSDSFSQLQNLEKIFLFQNKLQNLPQELFQNNKQLKEIRIRSNKLEIKLPSFLFANLFHLQTIDLSRNGIQKLPKLVFQNLTSLKAVNLQNNKLSSLPSGVFADLENLEKVNLTMNLFSKIELQQFIIYGNRPYVLNLKNNLITEVNYLQEKFADNVKNIFLQLNNNNITCTCSNYDFLYYIQRENNLESNKYEMIDVEGVESSCENITQQLLDCNNKTVMLSPKLKEIEKVDENNFTKASSSDNNNGVSNLEVTFKIMSLIFMSAFFYVFK